MALTLRTLPTLQSRLSIVDSQGRPTNEFLSFLNLGLIQTIALNQADLAAVYNALADAQEAAQVAVEAANEAVAAAESGTPVPDARSGSDSAVFTLSSSAFIGYAQVDLTGVSAGDLTLTGTAPTSQRGVTTVEPGGVTTAEYRIVEIDGITQTTLFTGTFSVEDASGGELGAPTIAFTTHNSASQVAAFSQARTSTGNISYRADIRKTSGPNVTNLRFYLYVKRAA